MRVVRKHSGEIDITEANWTCQLLVFLGATQAVLLEVDITHCMLAALSSNKDPLLLTSELPAALAIEALLRLDLRAFYFHKIFLDFVLEI